MAASPPLLDFDALLAPIAGDEAAGDSQTIFRFRDLQKELSIEENPDDWSADDPTRPTEFKKAQWPVIMRMAKETLTRGFRDSSLNVELAPSKDLEVAIRLAEALVKIEGFAGLRDGLHLLRRLVTDCWDRINPPIEDGDASVRGDRLANLLDTPDRGARFPTTVKQVPLAVGEAGPYGYLAWKRTQEGGDKGPYTGADFEKAMMAATPAKVQTNAEDLAQAVDELKGLTQALQDKMGQEAPALLGLRGAMEDCLGLLRFMQQRLGPAAGVSTDGEAAPEGGEAGSGAGRGASRDEVYRQLARAADMLQGLEPHSPVPYLVRRAVELGRLPFPELIKALIRDANTLAELYRDFGIKDQAPSEE
jgi:type VI secretion system protein ImpA